MTRQSSRQRLVALGKRSFVSPGIDGEVISLCILVRRPCRFFFSFGLYQHEGGRSLFRVCAFFVYLDVRVGKECAQSACAAAVRRHLRSCVSSLERGGELSRHAFWPVCHGTLVTVPRSIAFAPAVPAKPGSSTRHYIFVSVISSPVLFIFFLHFLILVYAVVRCSDRNKWRGTGHCFVRDFGNFGTYDRVSRSR